MSATLPAARPAPAAYIESPADAADVLARTVYGEARGEPVRGQEAVAAVVMNRVRRARRAGGWWWGATVAEVCTKPFQFSCWNAGDPNLPVLLGAGDGDPAFAVCRRIAARAVAGALRDPTRGATHYHAKGAFPAWARGRAPAAAIGRHLFYNDIE